MDVYITKYCNTALWGDTENITFSYDKTTMGPDGTNGNQPRGVIVEQNLIHEVGVWEKQSAAYFQAKSCNNRIVGNIIYNGPRAGINFNDGFGGNSTIARNLIFNVVRESSDHGMHTFVYLFTLNFRDNCLHKNHFKVRSIPGIDKFM